MDTWFSALNDAPIAKAYFLDKIDNGMPLSCVATAKFSSQSLSLLAVVTEDNRRLSELNPNHSLMTLFPDLKIGPEMSASLLWEKGISTVPGRVVLVELPWTPLTDLPSEMQASAVQFHSGSFVSGPADDRETSLSLIAEAQRYPGGVIFWLTIVPNGDTTIEGVAVPAFDHETFIFTQAAFARL